MAASFVITTVVRTALANHMNDDLDNGVMKLYSGGSPGPNNAATGTHLATFTLPAKASNTVANGIITFGALAQALALDAGTIGYFRLLKTDGVTVVADGNVAITLAALVLSAITVIVDSPINITSFSITVPAGT